MMAFKNLFLIFSMLIFGFACSNKEGPKTSSKIKIVGANAFSAGSNLANRAMNGLLLYGKSTDGKSFLKKIDSGVVDMSFSNGTWNFYAVAWDYAAPAMDSGFKGRVSCAKSLGVQLKGIDVVVNLNLSNSNCDGDFHPIVEKVGADFKLPKLSLFSCKNASMISSFSSTPSTDCDQSFPELNKGYATSFKIVVPEYNSSGAMGGDAITSGCMVVSDAEDASLSTTGQLIADAISLPMSGLNGFESYIKVYYSATPCDESNGFTKISLSNSTKKKRFFSPKVTGTQGVEQFFLETDAGPVCQGPRLDPTRFASGLGTVYSPFTICTPEQFKLIHTGYRVGGIDTYNKHFDLINDISFDFNDITAIGDGSTAYVGHFNGTNHRIENFRLKCGNTPQTNFGLFKIIGAAGEVSNLTVNKGVVDCGERSAGVDVKIGLIAGKASGARFYNIKAFGHVSGDEFVGGIVGYADSDTTISDSHFEGGVSAKSSVGGLAGLMTGTAMISIISRSSFKGEINAKCNVSVCNSLAGGLVGYAPWSGATGKIDQSKAILTSLYGSTYLGGIVGKAANVSIYDSIASGYMYSNAETNGSTTYVHFGGLVGYASQGNFSSSIAYVHRVFPKKIAADTTYGPNSGPSSITQPTCNPPANFQHNYGLLAINDNSILNCNTNANLPLSSMSTATTYATYFSAFPGGSSPFEWDSSEADPGTGFRNIPRLRWESSRMADIPYLENKCLGNYQNFAGAGTQSNPFIICTVNQFNLMVPGYYYVLKKNLNFDEAILAPKVPGTYFLDGNGYSLINFKIYASAPGNWGLFKELYSDSEIKNVKIVNSRVYSPAPYILTGNMNIGLLAGTNKGKIENVFVLDSSMNLALYDFKNYGGFLELYAGGLVGINQASGKILNSELNVSVVISEPRIEDDSIYAASIAAKNIGTIKGVRSKGSVNRSMGIFQKSDNSSAAIGDGCLTNGDYLLKSTAPPNVYLVCRSYLLTSAFQITDFEYIAGVVAYNEGLIAEVQYDGEFSPKDGKENDEGHVAPLVSYNSFSGKILDVDLGGNFNFFNYNLNFIKDVVADNNGIMSRIYFHPSSLFGFIVNNGSIFDGQLDNICKASFVASFCAANTASFTSTSPLTMSYYTATGPDVWYLGYSPFKPNGAIWFYDMFSNDISLYKTGGSFEKLGRGF